MDASTDPYQLLEIEHNADEDEVRKKFQSLAKVCHPDKLPPSSTARERASATVEFQKLLAAYQLLTDQERRRLYDAQWRARELAQGAFIHDTISLVEMSIEDSVENGSRVFTYGCRCGGAFVLLEKLAIDSIEIQCDTCSLSIMVDCPPQ